MTDGLVWERASRTPATPARRRLLGLERRRRRRHRGRRLAHPSDTIRSGSRPSTPTSTSTTSRTDPQVELIDGVTRVDQRGPRTTASRSRSATATSWCCAASSRTCGGSRSATRCSSVASGDRLRDGRHPRRVARRRARTRGRCASPAPPPIPQLINGLELTRSQYEGPTGIVGRAARRVPLERPALGVAVGAGAALRGHAAEPARDPRAARTVRPARRAAPRPPRPRPARRPLAGAGRPRDPRQRRGHRVRPRARGPRRRRRRRRARHRARRAPGRRWLGARTPTSSPPRSSSSSASRTATPEPSLTRGCSRRAPTEFGGWARPWCASSPACSS